MPYSDQGELIGRKMNKGGVVSKENKSSELRNG